MRLRRSSEPYEFDALATYNAERARGIAHHDWWVEIMRREKERFDEGRPSELTHERLRVDARASRCGSEGTTT